MTAAPPENAQATDEDLVVRARAGDESAFDGLVARHQEKIYQLAMRLSGAREDAEEVLQETFLQAYRNLGAFRGDAKFSTWLYRIATNAALMHRRASKRHEAESLEQYLPKFDDSGRLARIDVDYARAARADEILERAELAQRALEAVERLPEIYRAAFVLRDLEGLSTDEAADVLAVDPGLVRQRLHRARLMLRGYLGHLVGGEE